MNYCDNDKDKDKIISYIENILNDEDKKSFEHELQNNSELQKEYIDTKNLLNSLKNLPEVKTSRNFMVSLNSRIDNYERANNLKWYNVIENIFSNTKFLQTSFATMSIVFILTIGYYAFQYNDNPVLLSKASSLDSTSYIAIIDSLENDSLDYLNE